MLDNWIVWVIVYLVSAVVFAQSFKKSNRNMKNAGSLTILIEVFTFLFSILFIPVFEFKFATSSSIYLTLIVVAVLYSFTDRLNIEARYGLDPSTFSMLKQLSTVFLVIFGIIFLNEEIVIKKLVGAFLIIFSNILLTFKKGKIVINKYFIMSFISNLLFAIAMLINVNISDNFNLGIYTMITVGSPAIILFFAEKHKVQDIINEYNACDKKKFIIASFCWTLMLVSSVRAYQLGSVSVVAPLLTLTAILNVIYEYFIGKDKEEFIKKLFIALLILIGVLLIKL